MNWWGKVVGGAFGFLLGGPLGALLGGVLGHQIDQGMAKLQLPPADDQPGWAPGDQERVQTAFFTAAFTVMGRVAKADGRVTPDEIRLAERVMQDMQLNPEQRQAAIALFNQGRDQQVDILAVMDQLRTECGRRTNLTQFFLELQISTALVDGELHPEEQKLLRELAAHLGYSAFGFERLLAMVVAQRRFFEHTSHRGGHQRQSSAPAHREEFNTLHEAYAVLGVTESHSDAEIKKAYRRLISQHHPDKLVSKGLPEEMMRLATEKTRQIKAAHDQIMAARSAGN